MPLVKPAPSPGGELCRQTQGTIAPVFAHARPNRGIDRFKRHIDSALAVEVFVLEPLPRVGASQAPGSD